MTSTANSAALAGLRSICSTDGSFEEQLFLAHARRLFLRYHRAEADGEATDIRPYLATQLRRDFDQAVSSGRRIRPVASIRSTRIMTARDEEVSGEQIVVRFVALDEEQSHGVLGEDWTFERSNDMARWTGGDRTECPTCGGPRVRGSEICGYCGVPLASGGWIVADVETVSTKDASPISRQALLAIISLSALVAAAAVLFVVLDAQDTAISDPGAITGSGVATSTQPDPGVEGLADVTLSGALVENRSGDARTIGGAEACTSVDRFAGFTVTALPGGISQGTLTVGAALPGAQSGPGVYDGRDEPAVNVSYRRTDADGTSVSQSWHDGGNASAVLEVAEDGSMVLVFADFAPTTTAGDPTLDAALGGSVRFTCSG